MDEVRHRRLTGNADLWWIAAVFATVALVSTLLTGHLRTEFEMYRLGNQIAHQSAETRRLESERRSLVLERQGHLNGVAIWEAAESLGLSSPPPERIVVVESP